MKIFLSTFFFYCLTVLLWTAAAPGQPPEKPSCINCHEEQTGDLSAPVHQWRTSVHAQNRISCDGCHGGDPTLHNSDAMSEGKGFVGVPETEKIPQFCGKCHAGVMEDYLASAHGQALGTGGPQCTDCHGSHAVELASPGLINRDNCTVCHGFKRAEQIRDALSATDKKIIRLQQRLQKLHGLGVATTGLEGKLFSTRNTFHRLFHSVDIEKIRSRTGKVKEELEDIRRKIEQIDQKLQKRRMAGALVVTALILGALLFAYLHHTYRMEEQTK